MEDATPAIVGVDTGVLCLVAGVTHFLMPRDQLHLVTGPTSGLFLSFRARRTAFVLHYWAFSLASLLAIGLVRRHLPATTRARPLDVAYDYLVRRWIRDRGPQFPAHVEARLPRRGEVPPAERVRPGGTPRVGPTQSGSRACREFRARGRVVRGPLRAPPPRGFSPGSSRRARRCLGGVYLIVCAGSVAGVRVLVDLGAAAAIGLGPSWSIWIGLELARHL